MTIFVCLDHFKSLVVFLDDRTTSEHAMIVEALTSVVLEPTVITY
jgi:hypothetical protein